MSANQTAEENLLEQAMTNLRDQVSKSVAKAVRQNCETTELFLGPVASLLLVRYWSGNKDTRSGFQDSQTAQAA